jgi:hypothetical protein
MITTFNSLSRDHRENRRLILEKSEKRSELSTPSLGITGKTGA